MIKKYYITRHGQTFATKLKKPYGVHVFSAPILDEAKPPLVKMGKYLKDIPTDYHVSSEFYRCRQTAEIISKESQKEFVFDKRLNEHFIETFGSFRKRIQSFLSDLANRNVENVLIISHGAVIAGLTHLLLNGTFEKEQIREFPLPGILLVIENKTIQTIDFNSPSSQ